MAHIIRQSERVTRTEYCLVFEWEGMPGAGFSFDCDQAGNVDREQLQPASLDNLEKCLSGEHAVIAKGVKTSSWSYREPGILQCDCGREVFLDGFTCPCDCGRDYNQSGHLLAPRSQWGEETGESLADILRIR
jgi:hypothetical protein